MTTLAEELRQLTGTGIDQFGYIGIGAVADYIEKNYVKNDGLGEMIARKTLQYQDKVREQDAEIRTLKAENERLRKFYQDEDEPTALATMPKYTPPTPRVELPEKMEKWVREQEPTPNNIILQLVQDYDQLIDYLKEREDK